MDQDFLDVQFILVVQVGSEFKNTADVLKQAGFMRPWSSVMLRFKKLNVKALLGTS